MNAKELEILKKLLKIASNQQKVIEKLAQVSQPFYYGPQTEENRFDPMYGGEVDPDAPASTVPPEGKAADWLEKYHTNPDAGPQTKVAPIANLPAGVKEMLDVGAPGLKNNIILSFGGPDGKTVNVQFRSDKVNTNASGVKRVLTNALPGYRVMDPIGYMNPDPTTWHPNY